MPRSVPAVASHRRRKKILKQAKGYWGRKSKVYTVAKNQVEKSLVYAYRDRKTKKRHFRSLWITRINAAVREEGLSYSKFIDKLNKAELGINRKVLADLAMNQPETLKQIVAQVSKS